jgi:NitT/TauT family transport system substrate-binding protein
VTGACTKKAEETIDHVTYRLKWLFNIVDLWPIYRNAEGIVISEKLRRAGEYVKFFDPDTFGIRFVANSVITTEYVLKEHPKTVRKFMTALLCGWREALAPENEEKAVATIHEFDRDTPVDIIRKQLAATRMLMAPSPEIEVGEIDVEAWKQTEKIMLAQKLITSSVSVEKSLEAIGKAYPIKKARPLPALP